MYAWKQAIAQEEEPWPKRPMIGLQQKNVTHFLYSWCKKHVLHINYFVVLWTWDFKNPMWKKSPAEKS